MNLLMEILKVIYFASKFLFILFYFIYFFFKKKKIIFNRQVLCSDTVSQLLTENFIVWARDVSKPNHLNTLRKLLSKHITTNVNFFLPKKFPFIGILASIRGSLTLLDSSEGLFFNFLNFLKKHV